MNTYKKIIVAFGIFFSGVVILYAIDTIIVNIAGGQEADNPGSSNERVRTIGTGDMKLINKDNDESPVGDYFTGYYYDPAYGFFQMDASSNNVRISATSYNSCIPNYHGYELIGYSYNPDFGFMNFNQDSSNYTYICIPDDSNNTTLVSYIGGYSFSSYIGFQNFDGIELDTSVDITGDHDASGRFLKVDGIVSTQDPGEAIANQFTDDIRILGKITKTTLRKNMHQGVYQVIKNVNPDNGGYSISGLGAPIWGAASDGKILQGEKVLYFGGMTGQNVIVSGNDNLQGSKTLVVEGGNIYVKGNVRGAGLLGLMAIQKNGQGGNIYIDPVVTDIHAVMYADRSVISYNGGELDGNTSADVLANQLYIYGSIFSENTIGGSLSTKCPYYIDSCNEATSKKYDLNLLRRYILVQEVDGDGNPIGNKQPQFGGAESYMGDTGNTNTEIQKPGYRVYPLIIEYNPQIQQTPPPLF